MSNRPVPKSRKSRSLLVTVVALAGVVGYVVVGFLPGQKSLAAKRRELDEKRQFIANADLQTAHITDLEQKLQAARSHVERWRQHASPDAVAVTMLGELATLAGSSGVILHRLTPQDPAMMETLRQQTLEIEVEGAYSQVMEFLRGVEARPESIWMPTCELKQSKQNEANVQCALSLVIFADNRGNSG